MPTVTINLRDHRADPEQRTWDLPTWGHPLSNCILPLFIQTGGRFLPIGTAFWVGPKVQFILTAMHNVLEALHFEPRLERLLTAGNLPSAAKLNSAGLFVLHQGGDPGINAGFSLIPLRTINGAPPGDVAFGHPLFVNGRSTLSLPLSFNPPRIGETVWSVGYVDVEPREGIPVDAVIEGAFDWSRDYRHRFVVTEGKVERIFTQQFDRGYLKGPCFSFDNAISHGQSGGPVISASGTIVGINSCDVSIRFNRPTSLSSMIYPLLLTAIDFGVELGGGAFKVNMNASRLLIDLVLERVISSDGSEEHVSIRRSEDGEGYTIGPRISVDDRSFVHEDFQGFQDRQPAAPISGECFAIRRVDASQSI